MIYEKLAEILHIEDDERFNNAHIEAIKHAVQFNGNATVTITLKLKQKVSLIDVTSDGEAKEYPKFQLIRTVKVSQPIARGKESIVLGSIEHFVYVDTDGEVVTIDELPLPKD